MGASEWEWQSAARARARRAQPNGLHCKSKEKNTMGEVSRFSRKVAESNGMVYTNMCDAQFQMS